MTSNINDKLVKMGKDNDDTLEEMEDCFDTLTEEEVELFLMDALWVNERLLDYSDTLNDISDSIDTLNLADPIVLSEEEEESSSSGMNYQREDVMKEELVVTKATERPPSRLPPLQI